MELGRIFRHKFPPQPREINGPLGNMLGDLGMLVLQEQLFEAAMGDDSGGMFGGPDDAGGDDDW